MNKSLSATTLLPIAAPPVEALVQDSASRWLIAVALGSAALAVSAQLSIPMVPVPMTMQTYVVIMLGALCGWRLAALTVLAYLLEGAAGLPVFSDGHAGFAWLMGRTGGYLFGYLAAAAFIGFLADRGWNTVWWKLALSLAFGIGIGIFPVLGVSTPALAALALAMRLNLPAIQLVNYLASPVQLLMIIPFMRLGERVVGAAPQPMTIESGMQVLAQGAFQAVVVLWEAIVHAAIGWLVLGPLLILLLYRSFAPLLARAAIRLNPAPAGPA